MHLPRSRAQSHLPARSAYLPHRIAALILVAVLAAKLIDSGNTAISAETASIPNIVLILADDLGYGDLSCYGGWIETPHLDRLAEGGLRFTDYHSNGAVCSPTRAALLTGRYQQRAGIPGVIYADDSRPVHYHGLQPVEFTLGEAFGQAGYATAIFGKWHLGYEPRYNPTHHGFDVFRGYVSGNVDFFSHVDQAGNFDWWHNTEKSQEKGYVTHLITQHAIDFIKTKRAQPFFLYLPHEAPHYPYQGPGDEPLRKMGEPRSPAELRMTRDERRDRYRQMVVEMDRGIGQIIQTLQQEGELNNTLVFFCSDNGATSLGSNGELRGHKGQLWEGGHRVPAIASWPGVITPRPAISALILSMDVMPTLLEVAGIPAAEDRPFDGVSFKPLLTSAKEEIAASFSARTVVWNGAALRHGSWKFLESAGRGKSPRSPYVFDLNHDIGEQHNRADQHPELVAQYSKQLAVWRREMEKTATPQPEKPSPH